MCRRCALRSALQARQVSFVASAKKAQVLKDALVAAGCRCGGGRGHRRAGRLARVGEHAGGDRAFGAGRRGGEQERVDDAGRAGGRASRASKAQAAAEASECLPEPLPTRAGIHAAGTEMGCILKGGGGLYPRLVVGAVLLAAGSGSRLGGRPKPLLELGGVPLIRRQLIALSGAGRRRSGGRARPPCRRSSRRRCATSR